MKTILSTIIVASIAIGVQAQTNAPSNIATSVEAYFTSFNTNSDMNWTNVSYEIYTGLKQYGGNQEDELGFQKDIGPWNIGGIIQFSAVGAPIGTAMIQGGYDVVEYYDAKIEGDVRAGYDFDRQSGVLEPAIFASKKSTKNTALRIGFGVPLETKGKNGSNVALYSEFVGTF